MSTEFIDQLIRSRRSVFPEMYDDKVIEDDIIMNIIENATWAPNHKLTEPWRFKIFKGNGLKLLSDYLGEYYKEHTSPENYSELKHKKTIEKPLKCGCIVAVCYQKDPQNRVPEEEELIAMGAAIQNFWLTCTSYGIGCYLSTPEAIRNINKITPLQQGERCIGLFYMGWKKPGELLGKRTDLSSKITTIS